MNEHDARLTRLEERYTHLQDHVADQDRVILRLTEDLERLRRELARLRTEGESRRGHADDLPADEKPPHY